MASPSDPVEELIDRLIADGAPEWHSVGDLARMSMDAFAAQNELGRVRQSQGQIRLFGEATADHAAPMEDTGNLMAKIQRAVSAFGAALEGHTSQRGPLSDSLSRRTRLQVVASPAPGSLILDITPEMPVQEELPDDPQLPSVDDQPLVDQTVAGIVDLLASFRAGLNEALEQRLNDLGPRFAAAIVKLANEMMSDGIGVELAWQVPGRETLRARVDADDAARIAEFVTSRKLDQEDIELRGVLRTISDRRKWDVELDDERVVRMDATGISTDVIRELNFDQTVDIVARMTTRLRPGGAETVTYEVLEVRDAGS